MNRVALVLVVLLVAAGAAFFLLRDEDERPLVLRGAGPSDSPEDGLVLSYDKSGGFAGEVVHFEVHADGKTTIVRETTGVPKRERINLSREDLEAIDDLFAEAPWPARDTSYDEPNTVVADGYVYDITYSGVTVYAPDMRPGWISRLASGIEDVVLER